MSTTDISVVYEVTIGYDSDGLENPAERDQEWTLYSFSSRHRSYKSPEKLGLSLSLNSDGVPDVEEDVGLGLEEKLQNGLAFWLSYYEHGECCWMLRGGPYPAGVEFRWDGRSLAGLLVWKHSPDGLVVKTYDERRKSAEAFLEEYNDWANGRGLCYQIEKVETTVDGWERRTEVDSCCGFYHSYQEGMIRDYIVPVVEGHEFVVLGGVVDEGDIRRCFAKS
jgi:hypothetical protein